MVHLLLYLTRHYHNHFHSPSWHTIPANLTQSRAKKSFHESYADTHERYLSLYAETITYLNKRLGNLEYGGTFRLLIQAILNKVWICRGSFTHWKGGCGGLVVES
jgi:hypothetical protein